MKTCTICGFLNKDEACKCSVCNSDFDPATIKSSSSPSRSQQHQPIKAVVAITVIFIISCILMIPILVLCDSIFVINDLFATGACIFGVIFVVLLLIHYRKKFRANKIKNDIAEDELEEGDKEILSDETDSPASASSAQKKEKTRAEAFVRFNQQISNLADQFFHPAISFDEKMSVTDAVEQISIPSGLSVGQARMILSAIASRRLIVLCGESEAHTAAALRSVSNLTGTDAISVTLGENCTDPRSLCVVDVPEAAPAPSAFIAALCVGGGDQELCHIDVTAEAPNRVTNAFSDLIPYLNHPVTDGEVTVKGALRRYANLAEDETVALPANRRIFIRICEDRKIPFGAELLHTAAWIDVKPIELQQATAEVAEAVEVSENIETADTAETAESVAIKIAENAETVMALSFDRLVQLTENSEKECYLSEEQWKRIDELCDYISETVGFRMDNKLATAMERFTGIYIASGGSEHEATDAVIASLILPEALALLSCKKDCDRAPLLQFIDGHFGLENLPLCSDFLKKYGTI